MREQTPELLENPSPDGKYRHFAEYVQHCVDLAGTADQLGKLVGFSSGSRIGDWKKGQGGRPSLSSCLRLAKLSGDSPIHVLIMAGYAEEAAILQELLSPPEALQPSPVSVIRAEQAIENMQELLDAMKDEFITRLKPKPREPQ